MRRCAACPVRPKIACVARLHRRYCELAADEVGRPVTPYRDAIVVRSEGEGLPSSTFEIKGRPQLDPWTFVTTERLRKDIASLARQIPPSVDLIVAVSRSGLLPGADLAARLHLPLRTVSQSTGVVNPGHGGRMVGRDDLRPWHVLVIDDTAATGREMGVCSALARGAYPEARVTRAVVYCHPDAARSVDLCVAEYPGRHYLEWNWANAGHGESCGYDFDGILCADGVPDEWTLPGVLAYQAKVAPLYLPRRSVAPLICTGRGEESRAVSEEWLHRHGVRWDRLVMRPESVPHDAESIAKWKAGVYALSGCSLFAESEPRQAELIAAATGRAVLCPALERVIPAHNPAVYGAAKAAIPLAENLKLHALVRACVHRGCKVGCQKTRCERDNRDVYLSDCITCVSTQTKEVQPCPKEEAIPT